MKKKNKILLSIALCLVAFASMFITFMPSTKVSAADYNNNTELPSYDVYTSCLPFTTAGIVLDTRHLQDIPRVNYDVTFGNTWDTIDYSNDIDYNLNDEFFDLLFRNYEYNDGFFWYLRLNGVLPLDDVTNASYFYIAAYDFIWTPKIYDNKKDYTLVNFIPGSVSWTGNVSWRVVVDYYNFNKVRRTKYFYPNTRQFYVEDQLLTADDIYYIERLEIQCYIEDYYLETFQVVVNSSISSYSYFAQERTKVAASTETIVYEVDWFESIVDSVDSLLSIEILPEISFYDILIVCVCIPLLVAILKAWLGG